MKSDELKKLESTPWDLADTWRLYDNSETSDPILVASGEKNIKEVVFEQNLWNKIKEEYYE